jgi:hypothetical protein
LVEQGDEMCRKGEAETSGNDSAFATAWEFLGKATGAYRAACEKGALATAKEKESVDVVAMSEGRFNDALAAAEESLAWNPHSSAAARVKFRATWKRKLRWFPVRTRAAN